MARFPSFAQSDASAEPTELIAAAGRALQRPVAAYRDDAALLAEAELLFRVRCGAAEAAEASIAGRLRGLAGRLRKRLHRSIKASPKLHLGEPSAVAT